VFVVSYPRSGNTWVRFLLANLARAPTGKPVDFHTLPQVVPDLHLEAHWPIVRSARPPRLLKTHDLPDHRFRRVIYVLRDGRDVMVSHYLYLCGLDRFDGSLLEFLKSRKKGPHQWAKHVSAWLAPVADRSLLTVRYEDLVEDAAGQLHRMAEFAGLPHADENVEWAVERSSFETMRRLQDAGGRPYDKAEDFEHVRTGVVGDWRNWFEGPHKSMFEKRAGQVFRRCGYASDDTW